MQKILRLTVLFFLLNSCNTYKTNYPYSLDDFRPELRKHLEQIISQTPFGYIGDSAKNYIDNHTSEKELQKLLKSEHPVLRSVAFEYLSLREDFDCSNLLLENLDDTALIIYNDNLTMTVADYHISVSRGHTKIPKSGLIEKVINEHRNLYYAGWFFELESLKDEKYYTPLKEIIAAQYPLHDELKYNLIKKLSEYKKNEDTSFISNQLSHSWHSKNDSKFTLVKNNPIDQYFFAIEKFYKQLLNYNQRKVLQQTFWRDPYFEGIFENFISATAAYKSKRSAEIMFEIIDKKLYNNSVDKYQKDYIELSFKYHLLKTIKKYDCNYYKTLLPLIEADAKKYEEKYGLETVTENFQPDIIKIEEKDTW